MDRRAVFVLSAVVGALGCAGAEADGSGRGDASGSADGTSSGSGAPALASPGTTGPAAGSSGMSTNHVGAGDGPGDPGSPGEGIMTGSNAGEVESSPVDGSDSDGSQMPGGSQTPGGDQIPGGDQVFGGQMPDGAGVSSGQEPGDQVPGTAGAAADAGAASDNGAAGAPSEVPVAPSGTPTEEPLSALSAVRQEHSAAALAGEVYVIGGFTPSVSASVHAYSPASDGWRTRAEFPTPLHHANVAAVDDKIYVLGFNRGGSFTDIDGRVFAYDPDADAWSERAPLPVGTERSSSCVATLGSKIYLFGGSTNTAGTSVSVTYSSVYDTQLDEWQELPDLPEAREHCLAGGVGDTLYIVSGRDGGITGVSASTWAFEPATNEFTERAPIPTPRGGAAGAVLYDRIYVFGGEGNAADPSGIFHEVEAYDPATDTWQSLPEMTSGRHGFAAAVVESRIYLPGGATSQGFGAGDAHTVFFFE